MTPNLDILDTLTLSPGSHSQGATEGATCAREAIHLAVCGTIADQTPPGISPLLAILPRLNDGPWRDDAHRAAVLRPYLRRLATLAADPAADLRKTYAIADYAVRGIAGAKCEPITDEATARAAAYSADAAAAAADAAAYSSAAVAAYSAAAVAAAAAYSAAYSSAAVAAYSAAAVAAAAAYSARAAAAETIETHTRALLDIVCGG